MAASLEVEDRELQRVLLESLADQQNVAHNAVDDEALARALQEQEDSLLGYASPFRAPASTTYAPPSPYTAPTPAPSTLRTSSSNNRPINASATYPLAHPSFASAPTQSNSSTALRTSSSNNRPISTSSSYSAPSSTPAPTQSTPSTNTLRTSGSNNRIPSTAATYSVPSSAPAPPQPTSTTSTLRTSNSNNGRNGSVGNPILVDEYDSGSDDEITKSVLRLSQLEQTISDMDARILSYKGVVPSSAPAPPSAQAPPPITANSPTVAAAMNAVHSATNATLTIPRTSSTNNVNSSNTATGSSNRFVAPSPPQDADALSELLTKMSISSSNERTIRNNEKNNRSNRNHTEGVSGVPATTTTTSSTTTNNTNNNNNNSTIPTNPESDPSSEAKKSARHHSSSRDKGVRTTKIGGVRVRANGGTSDSGITRRGEKSSDDNRAEGDSGVRDVEMREAGDARRSTHSQKYRASHTSTSHSSTTSTSSTLPATTTPASTAGSSTSAPPQPRISTSTSFTSSQPITTAAPLPAIPSYSNIMGNTHTGTNSANPSRPPILYNYRPNNNPVNNTNPPNNVNSSQHQTNVYSSNNNTTTRITHNTNSTNTNSVNINISYGNGGVPPLHYVHTTNTVSANDNPRAPQQENNRPNQPNTQNNRETTADEEFAQRLQLQEALEAQREFDLMGPYNQINALIGGDENVAPYYDELFGLNGLNVLNGVNRQAGVPAFYLDEEGSDYSDGEGDGDDVDHMTYEQLLALGERIGNVSVGASKNEIESCPKFILKQELTNNKTCLVCQDDMQVNNTLRRLPCLHTYHSDCIDMWLKQKPTCPVCLHTIKNE